MIPPPRVASAALLCLAFGACGRGGEGARDASELPSFPLSSPAFSPGAPIPARFTPDGEDVSPALRWAAPPAGTAELALICHDPDAPRAGGWTHWVMAGIPSTTRELPEGIEKTERPAALPGTVQGRNDGGQIGWNGPYPPPGPVHHYHFMLYALDQPSGVRPGATKAQLEAAMRGHILARAELVGTFQHTAR